MNCTKEEIKQIVANDPYNIKNIADFEIINLIPTRFSSKQLVDLFNKKQTTDLLFLSEKNIMGNFIIRKATLTDYSAIITLQDANKQDRLSEEERKRGGFVSSNFTKESLDKVNNALGVWVAISGTQLVGFACMSQIDPAPDYDTIKAMIETFPQQHFNGKTLNQQNVFIYGPVCIDVNWRGKGLLKQLLAEIKNEARKSNYDVGVAFIDIRNKHSLEAHEKGLKMTVLGSFDSNEQHFHIVAFSTKKTNS